ncbi:uncharacterized protein LOC106178470 [Lingula anatina]|uniref:Uncharacterized protein LOC106178470 n=1 Tax=Lingula anatina TaxID=7574 RepID=A0A1S3K3A7_LINAN|nr:uncharacterized protein LOC106178470 [Lingula anatina]|eukprot:XP_013417113.1 uncharacterized protein LOC106178470 [Lingula anatina]
MFRGLEISVLFVLLGLTVSAIEIVDREELQKRVIESCPDPPCDVWPEQLLRLPSNDYALLEIHREKVPNSDDRRKKGPVAVKIKYVETFKNIPVFGQNVVLEKVEVKDYDKRSKKVMATGGFRQFVYGTIAEGIEQDLESFIPELTVEEALKIAINNEKQQNTSLIVFEPKRDASLQIYMDEGGKVRLAWYLNYNVENSTEPSRPFYFIDALDGTILKHWESIGFYSMTGVPGGNVKTGQWKYGELRWAGRPLDVFQFSATCFYFNADARVTNCGNSWACSCASGPVATALCATGIVDAINGAYSPLHDSFYFTKAVYDMYRDWFSDFTLPTNYGAMRIRAHYGVNYQNAFWNGMCTTYGDGFTTFYPLAVADVVSHELGHAYTEATSGLIYAGQSGGMNEAFSDIAGEAFKYYLRGHNDWRLGHDIMKNGDALRYMMHPPIAPPSIQCARYYQGQGVHYSSGIYNKAFYILATTPGWTTKIAFGVFARANRLYWVSNSNFNSGSCGVIQAAWDLGHNTQDVADAFAQVGVFCKCPPGFVSRNSWSCYKFVRDVASWAEANEYCRAIGAKLAVIEDTSEENWVENYVTQRQSFFTDTHRVKDYPDFWIAGNDIARDYLWKWAHKGNLGGTTITTFDWLWGQPNNVHRNEHCLALKRGMHPTINTVRYGWNDDDCSLKKFYICEKTCY